MKFALVGQSAESLELANEIKQSSGHQVAGEFPLMPVPEEAWTHAKLNTTHDSWESLLHGTIADAVILSPEENPDLVADCLRKLAQAAIPIWVIHPGCESILGYEIEMICRDSQGVVMPYLPLAYHPALARLIQLAQANTQGASRPVERLYMVRPLRDRGQSAVLQQLARDVQLLRMLVGEIQQVAAMESAGTDQSYANLCVQMRSSEGTVVTWAVGPAEYSASAALELVTADESFRVKMPADADQWSVETAAGAAEWQTTAPVRLARTALDGFVNAVNGEKTTPDWADACRDIEIAEAIPESLRRRRTIDLLYEEHSEQATFMGIMAIGGCGLLLLGSLFLVVAGIVEGLRLPFREHVLWRSWPIYLLVLLALFLLLQVLRFVFPTPSDGLSKSQPDA